MEFRLAGITARIMVCALALVCLAAMLPQAAAQPREERRDYGRDFRTMPELPRGPEGPAVPGATVMDRQFREGIVITSRDPIRTADNIGYATGRTIIEYERFILEADRMIIDYISGDLQAEGNVVLRGVDEFFTADSARFNLIKNQGVAYGVDGQTGDLYFRVVWDAEKEARKGPGFTQMDPNASVFRGMHYTTCDFPVPHYYISATEVILVQGQRVYFRNPVIWIRGVPVFYLPFYSRSLGEGSPWSIEFGYASRIGGFIRVGYRFRHRVHTPQWEDPSLFDARSEGLLDAHADVMTRRGRGAGARYRYQFDFSRHRGYLEVYGLRDKLRDVEEEQEKGVDSERWLYRHRHNSAIIWNRLFFQMDIDKASDPDIYWDVPDRFAPSIEFERGRLFEQRIRAALTYRHSDWIARVMVDRRDRLTRDRYTDFSNPWDDDLDFDPDPDFQEFDEEGNPIDVERRFSDDGISRERYGRISDNIHGRWGTRLLNIGSAPLYYRFEANAFDSLDAGFNQHSFRDDARVRGADFLGTLTHRIRLGQRTTWTNTVGLGAAIYDRDSNELITNRDFLSVEPSEIDGTRRVDGLRFLDRETIVLGEGDTAVSMRDVDTNYYFAMYTSRLNHRFTDFLDGFIRYRIRQGTSDSLGEFYESTGYVRAWDAIYDFYHDLHWVDAGLNYYLRYPNITASLTGGYNLQSRSDIYANERTAYAGFNMNYSNFTDEFRTSFGINYEARQLRDRGDPNEFEQGTITPWVSAEYFPNHGRYWARIDAYSWFKTREDPVVRDARAERRFDEEATEVIISPTVGKRFGPKYRVQVSASYNTRYESFRHAGLTILRDLHDAELGIFVGIRNNTIRARRRDRDDDIERRDRDREKDYELEVRTSVVFKIAQDQPGMGARSITTLSDVRREGQFVQ